MSTGAEQSESEETVFEREFSEAEVEAFAHPNILIEDGRVTIKSVAPRVNFVLLFSVYCIVQIISFNEGLAEFSATGCAVFIVSTALFLPLLARQRVTTVFDGRERTVRRRNPLHAMKAVPFDEIAEVQIVNNEGSVYFKITPKANRLGRGIRISRNYGGMSKEFLYIVMKVMPALSGMLDACRSVDPAPTPAMRAGHPVLYSRNGAVYTFTFWRNQGLALTVAGMMFLLFSQSDGTDLDDWMRWGVFILGWFGVGAFFVLTNRIIIDAGEKTIRFSGFFNILGTTVSLSRFAEFHVTREHTNGIYTHTAVTMAFRDPEVSYDFYSAVWTKKLSALVEETQAIIDAVTATETEPR